MSRDCLKSPLRAARPPSQRRVREDFLARRNAGMTLIELVVSIVVFTIGTAAILLAIAYNARHSADPMLEQQSINVAEGYLDEIEQQSYFALPNPPGRQNYNDVCDYNNLNEAPHDQNGNPIPGLGNYNVSVSVAPCPDATGSTPYSPVTIQVTVTPPAGPTLQISVLRANY